MFTKKISNYFRSCAICAHQALYTELICQRCQKQLEELYPVKTMKRPDYSFNTYSLLEWTNETEKWVKALVYGLKGSQMHSSWCKFAYDFSFYYKATNKISNIAAFVPAPGTSNTKDHAWLFANALSKLWQKPMYDVIRKNNTTSQKFRNLQERKNQGLHFKTEVLDPKVFTGIGPENVLVLVDDVITSGSTAQKCLELLEIESQNIEVWTLVAKPKSF